MKFNCKHCNEIIEITQSERAKHGLKKLYDHEAECFKKKHATEIEIINSVMRNRMGVT